MKWPLSLTLIRHGLSAYNVLKKKKFADAKYRRFVRLYEEDPSSSEARGLAEYVRDTFALGVGDYNTPLTNEGEDQSVLTGRRVPATIRRPDVIIYSPYTRTRQTLAGLCEGWPALTEAQIVEDDRIREKQHGLATVYNDWRVFHVLHPEQRALYDQDGEYWYRYPQGESIADVRDRVRSMMSTIVREYSGQHVALVTHHLTILSTRANLERLTPEEFIRLDHDDKPINCGVTVYQGYPDQGKNGRLVLNQYNQQLY